MPVDEQTIKVALVEDSPDEREALFFLIKGSAGFACLGAFSSGEEALAKLPTLNPHVVLMDINLPCMSGIECIRRLKALVPATRIMMLTVFEDHDRIFESLRAGASGYLVKSTRPAKLLEAIHELHSGGAPMSAPIARQVVAAFQEPPSGQDRLEELTRREREILDLLNRGFLYKEIADQLSLAIGTVRTHISRIYDKLHVRSRAQAMMKAPSPPAFRSPA
jgi:DNA-binding NarL/FixJ family response regulator